MARSNSMQLKMLTTVAAWSIGLMIFFSHSMDYFNEF